VLGHTGCSAVNATIEQLKRPVEMQSRNLRAIVDRVRPAVEPLLATPLNDDPQALVSHAVRANVRASASKLRHGSDILSSSSSATGCSSSARSTRSRPRRRVLRGLLPTASGS
jgi:carbonic anhydrase